MKNKEVLKMFYRIIITIVLTLGLSMSFQSVLADWRQPTADPPEDNVDPPIVNVANPLDYNLNDYAIIGQRFVTISGDLGLNGNLTVGGLTNCDTIDTDASGNFVCGTDDSGLSSITADNVTPGTFTGDFDINGNLVLSGSLQVNSLVSCDSIDTDASGNFVCGTDASGMGSLAANSVGSAEVIDNSLTAADLATGSVGSAEVIDNSLTAADLAPNSVGTSEIINSEVQNRVTSSCSYGINRINENGTVSCSSGNPAYISGYPVTLTLSSGKYFINVHGATSNNTNMVKIKVSSFCGETEYSFLNYVTTDGRYPITVPYLLELSCSSCPNTQYQEVCNMTGFTISAYTDFRPSGCAQWTGWCWDDTDISATSIIAIKVN